MNACTHSQTCTHTHKRACAHTHTHTHTHTSCISGLWDWRKGFWKEKGFQGRFKRADRGRMADRNRELVPDNWSLVRERALTTGLCLEGWYSEHSGVCRRAELPGGSVKVKKFWKGAWWEIILNQSKDNLYSILCSVGSQWRERSIGVMWADQVVLKMSLAALFCTFGSLEKRYLGHLPKVSCNNLVLKWSAPQLQTGDIQIWFTANC